MISPSAISFSFQYLAPLFVAFIHRHMASIKASALMICSALLVACGGGGASGIASLESGATAESTSQAASLVLEGDAVKGVISNGIARAYLIEDNNGVMMAASTPLGNAVRTDSQGHFRIELPAQYDAASVEVNITADDQTRMACDVVTGCGNDSSGNPVAFGDNFALSNSFSMKGVFKGLSLSASNRVEITPLSHLAVAHAEGQNDGLTAANIDAGKRQVENTMGLETGALDLTPPDITRLDQFASVSKAELEVAVMSASFLALVNSPDWNSIDEVLDHAANKMATGGSLTTVNMGGLPDVALDDLYYQAGELAQGLVGQISDNGQIAELTTIQSETQATYQEISNSNAIDPVTITQQPAAVSVNENENATMSVAASGGGTLFYQWRKDGDNIAGATLSSYVISSAAPSDAGTYDVVVSNSVGSVVSLTGLLTVNTTTNTGGSGGSGGSGGATTPVNNAPVAVNDSASVTEDASVAIDVLSNDSDADGDSLAVTSATVSGSGSVSINSNGSLQYTPAANFNGTETLNYSISDGQGGTASASVVVTVNAANDIPVAVNDAATVAEDDFVVIDALANDSDVDGDALAISSVAASGSGVVKIKTNGKLRYAPAANFNGTETLSYTISDGQGGTANASVVVTVTAVNDVPVAVADSATTTEQVAVSVDVLANDSDIDGDTLSINSIAAVNGTVSVSGGVVQYTPNTGYTGVDSIAYSVSDGNGGVASSSISITVNAAPVTTFNLQLSWDIPLQRQDGSSLELFEITGYTIKYGSSPSALDQSVSVVGASNTSYVVNNLNSGTWYFAIATVDSNGQQGAFSTTVSKTVM